MLQLLKSTRLLCDAVWLLVVVLFVSAGGVLAESQTNAIQSSAVSTNTKALFPSGPLKIEEATRRALACDPRIIYLRAAVEVARQQRLAATDIKDPVVQAESRSIGRTSANDDLDDSQLSLGVNVPNPWLLVPRVSARTADYRAAQADLNADIWLVQCEIQRLFSQLNYLTNDLVLTADRVRLSGELLKTMQARVEQGATTATELMTISRQYLHFQDDLDQINHSYQSARQQLALLLDIAPESFEVVADAATFPSLLESGLTFQQAEALASKSRWDLAALRWRALAAQSSYYEVRNERLPWIKQVKAGLIDNSFKNSDRYWIGIAADVPIFSWTVNHAADAALAKSKLAAVSEANGLKLIGQELHDTLDEMDLARRQRDRNNGTMKPLVATMRQTLATLKSTPNIMPEQIAAAELELVEALRFDLTSRWQYELALLNLEQALGGPVNQDTTKTAP